MSQEPETQEPSSLQHAAEHEQAFKKPSAMSYLAILFAAAFLLLLLSYFMQQRNSAETIEDLRESVTAMKSIESIQTEYIRLQEDYKVLEERMESLEGELTAARAENNILNEDSERSLRSLQAMGWLLEIERLHGQKSTQECKALIEAFEATGLKNALPTQALHTYEDSQGESPAQSYQAIHDELFPAG